MNFLSHYYFERHSRNPELVLGSVLPDLMKNADRRITIQPQKYTDRFGNNPKLHAIYRGWIHHMETDRLFHNSPFFYEHTHRLKVLIAPAVAGTPIRPSFLSHIALELLLDHLLLGHGLVHEADFYELLAASDREAVHRFLRCCEVPDTFFFFSYFNSFMRAQYVSSYRALDQLSSAMINICRRLWDFTLREDQKMQLIDAISEYVNVLDGQFQEIFEEIRPRLA